MRRWIGFFLLLGLGLLVWWSLKTSSYDDYIRLTFQPPDTQIWMPVQGVRLSQVANTFGAPRSGRRKHEGQDIFAPRGTPIFSATEGIVMQKGNGDLGGLYVMVMGAGGRRYYYAHLNAYAPGLEVGQLVTSQTLLGYVGNTGNARTTPPHLHFGVYGAMRLGEPRVIDPLTLLKDREWQQDTKEP